MRAGARPDNLLERLALAAGQAPESLFDVYVALMSARAIMAGHALGLYAALDERPDDAAGLAGRLGLDPRGLDVLLAALHALDYLEADGTRYRPGARARRTLLPGARFDLRAWTDFSYDMWDAFGSLEQVVRSGEPIGLHDRPDDDPYWGRYMAGLRDLAGLQGADVARAIGAERPRRMLDLAGGHGAFAVELCRRHPELSATVIELEGAARHGRRLVAEAGMADRIEYRVGDLFALDLGQGHDLVTAFQIVHHLDEAANVELLRRARAALRAGGRVAVLELERPAPGERGTPLGTLTGVLFFITSSARTYAADEIAGFLEAAGLEEIRVKRLVRAPGTVLVLGDAPA